MTPQEAIQTLQGILTIVAENTRLTRREWADLEGAFSRLAEFIRPPSAPVEEKPAPSVHD